MNDLISLIVPVYNEEKHLELCLDSLLNQSYENLEIICIDDGSTDNSPDILNDYMNNDSRITVLTQSNHGLSVSRNNGVARANGKYVLFVDADDWIEKDTIKMLYETAERNDSEIVLYNAIEEYTDRQRKRIYPLNNDNINWAEFSFDYTFNKKLVLNTYLVVWTKFFKKSFLDKYDLHFKYRLFEDNLFHIQSMIYAKKLSIE
jgi:glycosyltransferase involved in cell wall biosynthesis